MPIKIDKSTFERGASEAIRRHVLARADKIGAVLVSQTKRRFDQSGDEELSWPGLWVNNSAAVASVTKGPGATEERRRRLESAKRSEAVVRRKISTGALGAAEGRKKLARAKSKTRNARDIARSQTSDLFRGGGKPLQDTRALENSINSRVVESRAQARGSAQTTAIAEVVVGTPLQYGDYHQRGFSTKPGSKNYIPLTRRAQRGWNQKLVSGYDYVILDHVTVPARPFVRLTTRDRADIVSILTGR